MSKRPNFFIVGAPKSGTTSLYTYLKKHPDVFLPKKELYYFCFDLGFRTPPISEETYLSYYSSATSQNAIGDASVYYLLSRKAAENIKRFNPEAKIIIMLREPADMVYSLHSELQSNGDETIQNFEQAIELEAERKQNNAVGISPHHNCPIEAFLYSDVAKYYEQVKRYKDAFGDKNLHIILFDDFKNDPLKEYKKVLQFLGLSDLKLDALKAINPNKVPRNRAFMKFLINPPYVIKKIGTFILPHHTRRRELVLNMLWRINTRYVARKPISPETRAKLKVLYRADMEKLQLLIGRDLSSWLN